MSRVSDCCQTPVPYLRYLSCSHLMSMQVNGDDTRSLIKELFFGVLVHSGEVRSTWSFLTTSCESPNQVGHTLES